MKPVMHILVALALAAPACTDTYNYDPATAGDPEGARDPRPKSSTQFVRGLYSDLLNRAPDQYEVAVKLDGAVLFQIPIDEELQLTTALDGLGDSLPLRNVIAQGLLRSAELALPERASIADPRAFIREQFRRLLGREPNAYELAQFAAEWAADLAVGPRTIIRAIVGSREYQSQ